ncbi:hypothetical protein T492DRAFT_877308 [Pavlovales sp. CCMP2436]|nr:hypothetical protein T492DRAFT_877308 [Pavlovales sp. CCMP2436]
MPSICIGADCEAKPLAQRKHPSYAREGAKAAFCQAYAREGAKAAFCQACAAHEPMMVGVTHKQCAHCQHATANAGYGDGSMCAAFIADAPSYPSMRHNQCDENKHARELPECRQQRAWRISDSFGGRPVVFLRFNPDRFGDKQGAVHPSCFALKRGVLTLAREAAWLKRLGLVVAHLRYHLCTVPDAHLVEEFLFYRDDSRVREAGLADTSSALSGA